MQKGSSSPYINHFLQPDSLIPNAANPQMFNRYSYVGNNPVNFNDPTGHMECEPGTDCRSPGSTGRGGAHIHIGGSSGGDDENRHHGHRDPSGNLKEDLKIEEPTTFIGPNPYKENACHNGNLSQSSGPSASEALRGFCGKFDPTLVNPELGGTTLNYAQMMEQTSAYLTYSYGLDPTISGKVSVALPFACFAYNCVNDAMTGTGEHSNLRNIRITPQGAKYTIIAIPIAAPIIVIFSPIIINAVIAFFISL